MILYELTYALLCIVFAVVNANLIKAGKRIYHGLNAGLHLSVMVIACWLYGWPGIVLLFIARVFFDWSLNILRGLPLGYVSPAPKATTDKLEKRIFGLDGITPKIIYLTIIIVVNLV
jgi:hypothetical protein